MLKEILVIDDNPDIRFLICNILEEQNFKVRSAANFDQAVLEINNRLPDLAIVDIKLDKPDKDGLDLLKLIVKNNKSNEWIKAIKELESNFSLQKRIIKNGRVVAINNTWDSRTNKIIKIKLLNNYLA